MKSESTHCTRPSICRRFAKLAAFLSFAALIALPAQAQTFSVIHTFTGGSDGYQPYAGLTIDSGGHLYGTTTEYNGGTVFEMKPDNGGYVFSTIYDFKYWQADNGLIPYSRVVFGPGGSMFGTTLEGGNSVGCEFGCGAVYNLRPPRSICRSTSCAWSNNVIESFSGGADGYNPNFVDPVFDQQGNLYGTTAGGGAHGVGNVFKLTHSGGQWTASNIYEFSGSDGSYPFSGVIWDQVGNLYGTTGRGGQFGEGSVYRLSPSGSGWTLTTLHSFRTTTDGSEPVAALTMDSSGNLYGSTVTGGSGGGGTVFKLTPAGGGWNFSLLYSFVGGLQNGYNPGVYNALALDTAGNVYGALFADTLSGYGAIFKLTPTSGGWSYTSLHDFTGGDDGGNPIGGVTFDSNGNLYGTTAFGGLLSCTGGPGCGVVWRVTP